jgi:alcohol dehydrogenase (cytochrome c)
VALTSSRRTTLSTTTAVNENVSGRHATSTAKSRKVLLHADRNGFFYVIDRTNGRAPARVPVRQDQCGDALDMKTGRPVETGIPQAPARARRSRLWPAFGVKNWAPDWLTTRKNGTVYLNTIHYPQMVKLRAVEYKPGQRFHGAWKQALPGPAGE